MSVRLYCTLDDVKRLLRATGVKESRVRFSSAYKDLKAKSDNSGSVFLKSVNFLSSYNGHETFTFTFTDSTSFDVVGNITGNLGSGTLYSKFTAIGKFTCANENWSGRAQAGDEYYITANSDVSDDDGEGFIEDAGRFINSFLKKTYGTLPDFTVYGSTETIPDAVVYACMRYAAYEIFNSIFAGAILDEGTPVQRWKDMADEAMSDYSVSGGDGPRWRARDSVIVEIGVKGVGEGIIDIETISTASNKDFKR